MIHRVGASAAGIAMLLSGACSGGTSERADTIAGVTSGVVVDAADSTAGPEAESQRPDARDADHEFLRELADRVDAIAELGRDGMSRGATARTRADAHRLHTTLEAQRDSVLSLIRSAYDETLAPQATADDREMVERVRNLSGPPHDRAFYETVVSRLRAVAQVATERLPHLARPDVQRLARRVAEEYRERAEELERSSRAR